MKYYGGIDVGSTSSEFVVIDEQNRILSSCKSLTGGNVSKASQSVLERTFDNLNITIEDFTKIVSTGYGRKHVPFADKNFTEITCYARGAIFLFPGVRTIIDIGGQDSKVISIDEKGSVKKFLMNDKCAAGTGRFLEMISKTFDISIESLGDISLKATEKIKISNICTVFAESEIISLFSTGVKTENIIAAAHISICERIMSLLKRVRVIEPVVFCGGVACNKGMESALGGLLDLKLLIPDDVFTVGALGAALLSKNI